MQDNVSKSEAKKTVEAALFVSARSLSIDELAKITGIASTGYIKDLIDGLMQEYDANDSSLKIEPIGNGYVMTLKEPYASKVSQLAGQPEISRPALRILAYISKNEPIMQSKIIGVFGPAAYSHIKELVEKGFIKASRQGRTKRLDTTQKFKEYFDLAGSPTMEGKAGLSAVQSQDPPNGF
ncbi:MAG: SMC-Scp complex subunit ScpB [Candidatus Micrarchaeales archaeon]|nr:SMC-Scp complex subunit ScpB [Candidatus Micrarchaeales archaeon]